MVRVEVTVIGGVPAAPWTVTAAEMSVGRFAMLTVRLPVFGPVGPPSHAWRRTASPARTATPEFRMAIIVQEYTSSGLPLLSGFFGPDPPRKALVRARRTATG